MSINVDASQWRLQTDGGIPYKLKEGSPSGSFGDDSAITEIYIIRASDLQAFIYESTSTLVSWPGGIYGIGAGRAFPGIAGLLTTDISFKPLESSKPCDPWGIDSGAPDGTYCPYLELTIKYSTLPGEGGSGVDPNDPETILEVTADTSVSILQMAASSSNWNPSGTTLEPPEDPNIPAGKLEAQTEWTISYPKFPWQILGDVMLNVRQCLGHVNSVIMPILGNAAAETILFSGLSVRRQLMAGADGFESGAQVTLKLTEKNVKNDDSSEELGHNHFYRPEKGEYQLLLINGNRVYKSIDLNIMWATS